MSDLRIPLIPLGQSYGLSTSIQQGIWILCHKIISNLCISFINSILFFSISLSSSVTNDHNHFLVHILFLVIIKRHIFIYYNNIVDIFKLFIFLIVFHRIFCNKKASWRLLLPYMMPLYITYSSIFPVSLDPRPPEMENLWRV